MDDEKYYNIEIYTDESSDSLVDNIKSLYKPKKKKEQENIEPIILTNINNKDKKNKKTKKSKILRLTDDLDIGKNSDYYQETDEDILLDIDKIMKERDEEDIGEDLTSKGKKGYKDLKKNKNNFKKEFAEELTLLYALLDETSKFGKSLEKDLTSIKGSKVRGVSKYTNDLAQLVLNSKQNKLSILKEITDIKKTVANLTMKSESSNKDNESKNNPEYLASAYLKNILNHGRNNFIENITGNSSSYEYRDDYGDTIDRIEKDTNKDDIYDSILLERLSEGNPYRSEAGTKYIEYENRGVKLFVKKCVDTGEWEFIAIDKTKQQIYDYPVPTKREAGRMKFSDDGTYATDSKGRIYNVLEYFLPEE